MKEPKREMQVYVGGKRIERMTEETEVICNIYDMHEKKSFQWDSKPSGIRARDKCVLRYGDKTPSAATTTIRRRHDDGGGSGATTADDDDDDDDDSVIR